MGMKLSASSFTDEPIMTDRQKSARALIRFLIWAHDEAKLEPKDDAVADLLSQALAQLQRPKSSLVNDAGNLAS
jgi:hypothetical protein